MASLQSGSCSTKYFSKKACRRPGWKGARALYTNDEMPYSAVSGVSSWPWFSAASQPDAARARSMLKRPVLMTARRSTSLLTQGMTRAPGLSVASSAPSRAASAPSAPPGSVSHLLSRMTSANSTWSNNRSATLRSSSSSTLSSPSRSLSVCRLAMFSSRLAASTTVTHVSSRARDRSGTTCFAAVPGGAAAAGHSTPSGQAAWSWSAAASAGGSTAAPDSSIPYSNVSATCMGSPMPVLSMTR
mmetsp:Transcript_3358/g.8359  ORF Transcript_3358/g.8359 Transcript_3358/m.8359 type:complete len:244 (-) Transcript_3358:982-1713(-)